LRPTNWLNYEVSEEEWKLNWKFHIKIIKELQEMGWRINLMIYNTEFVFKGEKGYNIITDINDQTKETP